MSSIITLGLAEILVGAAAPNGTMPADNTLTKIGKTYTDTCKINQAKADVTEHKEEGRAAPEYRKKTRKIPVITFSIMDPDVQFLIDYIGGSNVGTEEAKKWGYDGSEAVSNKSLRLKTEQGLWFDVPNGDIEANINSDLSSKGIFLVDFEVTPMSVSAGKALVGYPKPA